MSKPPPFFSLFPTHFLAPSTLVVKLNPPPPIFNIYWSRVGPEGQTSPDATPLTYSAKATQPVELDWTPGDAGTHKPCYQQSDDLHLLRAG